MRRGLVGTRGAVLVGVVILAVVGVACGGGEEKPQGPSGPGAGGGPSGALVVTTTDNKFDKTTLTAQANQATTLTLMNKGEAIHSWHVLNVKSADGKDIATQLLAGGKSETITFTIATPGAYDFQCDTHPTEMKGKLTVK